MGGGRGGCLLLLTQVEPTLPTKFLTNFVFSMKSEQKINFPTQADAEPGAACNDCCLESFLVQTPKTAFCKTCICYVCHSLNHRYGKTDNAIVWFNVSILSLSLFDLSSTEMLMDSARDALISKNVSLPELVGRNWTVLPQSWTAFGAWPPVV